MSLQPIDLRTVAGKRYRVEYEESHSGKADNPWLLIIPCHKGHIYPHSGELLGVATNTRGPTANAIRRLPGVEIVQDGDDGINAVFPVKLFSKVAKLMKAKRKRQLSDEQREQLVNMGKATRLKPRSPGCQSAGEAQNRLQTGQLDTLAV